MADPILATGTLLKIGDGSTPPVFTAVAQLRSVTPLEITRNEIETSVHNTPGGWETFITGMLRSGQAQAEINWLPSDPTHDHNTGALSQILYNTKRRYQITFPGGFWMEFDGYLSRFGGQQADVDDVLKAQVTVKATGPVIFP